MADQIRVIRMRAIAERAKELAYRASRLVGAAESFEQALLYSQEPTGIGAELGALLIAESGLHEAIVDHEDP